MSEHGLVAVVVVVKRADFDFQLNMEVNAGDAYQSKVAMIQGKHMKYEN